jgi:diguanylate cyclase (GGDEF)-like protein
VSRARSAAIWVLVAGTALTALAVHTWLVAPLPGHRSSWPAAVPWLLAVGFFVAELLAVHIRFGREAYTFSLMELPLVLGLFFVRPELLVLCRLGGAAAAFICQRKAPQKAAFNLSLFALETSAAVAIWHLVLDDGEPVGPSGWLATLAAVALTGLLSSTLVSVVITVATGERPGLAGEIFGLGQVGDLANACFALVAVYILATDWRAIWLLGVVVGVLVVAYRTYENARARSESLEQVNRFTEVVGHEVELEGVVAAVLSEVRGAFEADVAELRLARDGTAVDWVFRGAAPATRTSADLIERLEPHAESGTLLQRRGGKTSPVPAVLRGQGVRDAVMVPLRSEGRAVGSLLVADRVSDVESFTPADLRQLQAFANHAAVAIDSAVRAQQIIDQAEERERQAMYDELTGLANRRLFGRRLGEELAEGRAAVLLLDLDRFQDVNDTLGHEIGDRLLVQVATRLREAVRDRQLVARFGGDEFAILLEGADQMQATDCATRVQEVLAQPFHLDGIAVAIEASIGVAIGHSPEDELSMLRWADVAMYVAKTRRSGCEVYRPELDRGDRKRLGLLADLRAAIEAQALQVHYQPKVSLRAGDVEGVEALARWTHPQLGRISPDDFIPLAEHSSLITPLTMLVLATTLRDCEPWLISRPGFSVAVNISPRSLLDPAFVDSVARALAVVSVPSSALTLEITETSLMADPERVISALEQLTALGVRLSVDDLGTGYSSLAYLQRLPVHEVKIDRSFLSSLPDPSSEAVIAAVVQLGHRLGRHVVAEGVETGAAYDMLRLLECDSAQGYWLSRPLPSAQLSDLLQRWAPPAERHLQGIG